MSRLTTEKHKLFTEAMLENLFDKNIYTTFEFVQSDVKKLMGATNLSYKDAIEIKKHLINKNSAVVRNGADYYTEFLQKSSILPTGIKGIDKILGGGVGTGKIYEICGLPDSGKTQFCLTLAKNLINSLNQNIYFLDTKHDFNPKRFKRMFEADNFKEEQIIEAFKKLLIKQITTIYDLINSLYEIKEEIKNGLNIKLIIIDSLPAVLYQFQGAVDFNPILNHLINIIRFLSVEMHICFVVTNVYTRWYAEWSNNPNNLSYTENIGCGNYWKSIPNARLTFRRQLENNIEVSLEGDFISKIKTCILSVTNKGIC